MDSFCFLQGLEGLNVALHNRAKYRDVDGVNHFLRLGADAHSIVGGMSVIERVLTGEFADWKTTESVVRILSDHGVTKSSVKYFIIHVYCGDLVQKSKYIRTFLRR